MGLAAIANLRPAIEPGENWVTFRNCCVSVRVRPASSTHWGTLVFLHGRFSTGDMWSDVSEALAQHFETVLIDLPGFGTSFCMEEERGISLQECSELVGAVATQVARGPLILVGHDLGGAIAQYHAWAGHGAVRGLILIDSPCLSNLVPAWQHGWAARRRLKKLLRTASELAPEHVQQIRGNWFGRDSRRPVQRACEEFHRSWPGPFQRQAWRESMARFEQPVLLLWGARDELIPPDEAFEMIRTLPETYFFQHERSGHWPCLEQTDWVVRKIREFLFRIQGRGSGRVSFSRAR
jgi:pimeloyl-ACP methyl ester carboxylesterase